MIAIDLAADGVDAFQQFLHQRRLFLAGKAVGLVENDDERLVEFEQRPDRLHFRARQVAVAHEQDEIGALRLGRRHVAQAGLGAADAGHVGQQDLRAVFVTPAIVSDVARRAANDIHHDVGIGRQRLDQGTLSGADFAEETQVHLVAARGQFPEFRLRLADIHASRFRLAQA